MPIRQKKKSLSEFRQRLKRRGVVRLEVHVRKDDAALVRGVVTALSDPSREFETRTLLQEHFGASKATGLKALLVSAPLEGIDLSRNRDVGRPRSERASGAMAMSPPGLPRSMMRTFF